MLTVLCYDPLKDRLAFTIMLLKGQFYFHNLLLLFQYFCILKEFPLLYYTLF